MIKLIEYLLLGIIQGITEPIPVSSSGHILILQTILKKIGGSFNVNYEAISTITNFGSLVAIAIIFWPEIVQLIKSFFTYLFTKNSVTEKETKLDFRYCLKIIVATIPAGLFGIIALKLNLLQALEKNVKFLGIMLLVTAVFLYLIKDFVGKKNRDGITFKDALIIGLYQMVSVTPGISRSGATIVGGMYQGLTRETAFNFSFILYIPISIATTLVGLKDLFISKASINTWMLYIISAIAAGIFTYIFTKWYKDIVKKGKLIYFSIYCVIAGLLVILFL